MEKKPKMFYAASKPPHITKNDEGILRRIMPNEECWRTGNYTDLCDCEFCSHKHECSGYDKEEE